MNIELLNDILHNQRKHWANVVKELIDGKKETHWCWYFLPNVPGLGKSESAKYYALDPETFVEFFINSSEYRGNLISVINMIDLTYINLRDLEMILGEVDALKHKSFMTLLRTVRDSRPDLFNGLLPGPVDEAVRMSDSDYGVCEHTREAVQRAYCVDIDK